MAQQSVDVGRGNASGVCEPRQADVVGYILITHLWLGDEWVQEGGQTAS